MDRVDDTSYCNHCVCCCSSSLRLRRPQASRDPLPPEAISEIFEDVKDMGVLIGKGGIYGQVAALNFCPSSAHFLLRGLNTAKAYATKLAVLLEKEN